MTEIPEHLRRRADAARAKWAAADPTPKPWPRLADLTDEQIAGFRPGPRSGALTDEQIAAAYGIPPEELRAEREATASTSRWSDLLSVEKAAQAFYEMAEMIRRAFDADSRAKAQGYDSALDLLEAYEAAAETSRLKLTDWRNVGGTVTLLPIPADPDEDILVADTSGRAPNITGPDTDGVSTWLPDDEIRVVVGGTRSNRHLEMLMGTELWVAPIGTPFPVKGQPMPAAWQRIDRIG